jgi:hypothetical protein
MRRFEREASPAERTAWIEAAKRCEWLETDGLGGFASGTVSMVRSRRYHALLLAATTPPTGRFVLVNGFDARSRRARVCFRSARNITRRA